MGASREEVGLSIGCMVERLKSLAVQKLMPFMFFSGNGISSKVPIKFLSKSIEGGVPVDGIARGKLLFEIAEGTNGGDEKRSGGSELVIGQLGVVEVFGETIYVYTEKNGFLIEVNVASIVKQQANFIGCK